MKSKKYWENWNIDACRQRVERCWRDGGSIAERRKHFYDILVPYINQIEPKSFCDHGCGTGEDYEFYKQFDFPYRGADVTPQMLEVGKRRYPGINVEQDDVFSSKFPDNSFDLVVQNSVLLHVPIEMIPQGAKELYRITKKLLTQVSHPLIRV